VRSAKTRGRGAPTPGNWAAMWDAALPNDAMYLL
jgi:hypothetical protein